MHIDQAEEWRRLTEHYSALYDEELLNLAIEPSDLTETAQQVLRDEMKKRGLDDPRTAAQKPGAGRRSASIGAEGSADGQPDEAEQVDDEQESDYTWKTALCECEDSTQAWQLVEELKRGGIDAWIDGPQFALSTAYPRVLVAADQLEQARAIAAQPISQDIVNDSKIEMPEFETPHCPACGAADPILTGVEPANAWQCESCGREWMDSTRYVSEKKG